MRVEEAREESDSVDGDNVVLESVRQSQDPEYIRKVAAEESRFRNRYLAERTNTEQQQEIHLAGPSNVAVATSSTTGNVEEEKVEEGHKEDDDQNTWEINEMHAAEVAIGINTDEAATSHGLQRPPIVSQPGAYKSAPGTEVRRVERKGGLTVLSDPHRFSVRAPMSSTEDEGLIVTQEEEIGTISLPSVSIGSSLPANHNGLVEADPVQEEGLPQAQQFDLDGNERRQKGHRRAAFIRAFVVGALILTGISVAITILAVVKDGAYKPYSNEDKASIRRLYNVSGPCNDKGEIEALLLSRLQLGNSTNKPKLPPELTLLSSLKLVGLPGNELNGTFDDLMHKEIYQMPSLRLILFNYNSFTGTIPEDLWQMTKLSAIEFWGNQLTGTLPSQLGLMTDLRTLDFESNPLNGTIPTETGMMESLRGLWLAYTQVSGPLPSEIGLATSLTRLNTVFNNPGLSGALPLELSVLPNLQILELSGNRFTGTFPPELGQLTGLFKLAVDDNSISGTIPSNLGLLAGLQYLEIHNNCFWGTFPEAFATLAVGNNVSALQRLTLGGNQFSGVVPPEVCSLGDWDVVTRQGVAFDCNSTVLCGCDFCSCHAMQNYTVEDNNQTAA
ncbi:LRR receptor-like serine threonine-protein kinase [Seminavis robusta]|uniref:LRR receptor-like serine threonine-protein kinase n=1 Tax=Seminavis robusta TaxID=568900 RepID=A0A9N8HLM9_9STRA|nr:LRR receptor-like serine threonine-protein kinase [Seminavis robusta]|eukprot:Sro835_g208810.1 LRR receptor-like serine threonine-protein kinase (615) ;mRNA; f:14589-16891